MFKLSRISKKRLDSCHPLLQQLVFEVLKEFDVSVLCGYRSEKEQNDCFKRGVSRLKYPNSKHNSFPSLAVDIAPFPIDWQDIKRFEDMSVVVKRCWEQMSDKGGYELGWGGDWASFKDYPHFELKTLHPF